MLNLILLQFQFNKFTPPEGIIIGIFISHIVGFYIIHVKSLLNIMIHFKLNESLSANISKKGLWRRSLFKQGTDVKCVLEY